ncbi:MAG TPA: hypothetical protein VIU86_11970 [Gaiellaceae bacterium]
MIRRLLLRLGDACAGALPPDWRRAAQAEAREIESTRELACWTLGLVRVRLSPRAARRRRARRS